MDYDTLSLVLLLIIFLTIIFNLRKFKLPPVPKPWPIIGNIHQLGDKPHRSIADLSKTHGPIMSLKLGSITTIIISSSDVAKQMFLNHDLALSSRNIPAAGKVANHYKYSIGWLPVCLQWQTFRKISTLHLFTNKRLDASQSIREKKVDELVEYARDCHMRGRGIEISKAVFTTSINVLSNTLFSIDLASYVDGDLEKQGGFKGFLWEFWEEAGNPNLSDVFPLIMWLDLQGVERRIGVCFDKIMGVFEKIIGQRLSDPGSAMDDGLGNFLKLVQDKELSLESVKHLLFDLFIAGTDTTSTTIEWANATKTRWKKLNQKLTQSLARIDQFKNQTYQSWVTSKQWLKKH